jgi:hypothetical protein
MSVLGPEKKKIRHVSGMLFVPQCTVSNDGDDCYSTNVKCINSSGIFTKTNESEDRRKNRLFFLSSGYTFHFAVILSDV